VKDFEGKKTNDDTCKKKLSRDSCYDFHFCMLKMSEEKKDKSNFDDIAHYGAKLKLADEMKKKAQSQSYYVSKESGQMEVWSSRSEDDDVIFPPHRCLMAKTISP